MKKYLIILILVLLYIISYVWFRQTHIEVYAINEREYVIFPNSTVYYFYRPLSFLDDKVTDMRFHIGPHEANN